MAEGDRPRLAAVLAADPHLQPWLDATGPLDADPHQLAHAFLVEHGILERNPFEVLDQEGVGDLMRIAVERGRGRKPGLKMGICGEHGGEPKSVAFCHRLGLDYVSCSPYRVPLARLAAAQAALAEEGVTALAIGG